MTFVVRYIAARTRHRFCCPTCGTHHLAWCDKAEQPGEDAEGATKDRPCISCSTDPRPTKKQKKAAATLVRDENAAMETSM